MIKDVIMRYRTHHRKSGAMQSGTKTHRAHRDAKSAWQWLAKKGGIEPEGRDLPLVTMLKDRLDPEASGLAEALSKVTVTVFLNTVFGVISPFRSEERRVGKECRSR